MSRQFSPATPPGIDPEAGAGVVPTVPLNSPSDNPQRVYSNCYWGTTLRILVMLADRDGVVNERIDCEQCLASIEQLIAWGLVERLGPHTVRVLGMNGTLQ